MTRKGLRRPSRQLDPGPSGRPARTVMGLTPDVPVGLCYDDVGYEDLIDEE
ncbi:MAG: hypothetical protein ACRDRY_05655 [Pseudonocardiaceae bacterium]